MSKPATFLLVVLAAHVFGMQARAEDEPAVEADDAALPYLRAVHAKVHPWWADNFLLLAGSQLPKDHPINVASRRVELDLVLSAKGALLDVRVAKSSGAAEFDTSAVESMRAAGAFPPAPETVLSDDGKVYLRWALARDHRRCSGLAVAPRSLPLAEAVRALVARDQDGPAIARLQAADEGERMAGMDAFARAWLDRNENDKALALDVAVANALAGDARGAATLRGAVDLAKPDAPDGRAARGLAALGIPICPLIRSSLARPAKTGEGAPATATGLSDEKFAQALRERAIRPRLLSLVAEGASDACLAFAIAVAKDRSAPAMDRTFAIMSLERSDSPEAKAALHALAKEPDPKIQSQVIGAEARPGAGRGAVFRLTPLLRDKSSLVRAAAAAALVRVGGEDVLPQLFLIYKENDSAIYVAVAGELAKLSGAASGEMLGRFLKKDNLAVRVAAARALAARRDDSAAKQQATLATAERAELQLLAGLALAKEKREATVRAQAADEFIESYSALLRGSARVVAADWLLAQFAEQSPTARAHLLGQWLATRPKAP
jgi:TonB family protein